MSSSGTDALSEVDEKKGIFNLHKHLFKRIFNVLARFAYSVIRNNNDTAHFPVNHQDNLFFRFVWLAVLFFVAVTHEFQLWQNRFVNHHWVYAPVIRWGK